MVRMLNSTNSEHKTPNAKPAKPQEWTSKKAELALLTPKSVGRPAVWRKGEAQNKVPEAKKRIQNKKKLGSGSVCLSLSDLCGLRGCGNFHALCLIIPPTLIPLARVWGVGGLDLAKGSTQLRPKLL